MKSSWLSSIVCSFCILCLLTGLACSASPDPTVKAETTWPPEGESMKFPVTRDTWLATLGEEIYGSNGGASQLKVKGQQEYVLMDIDASSLKGKLVSGALLHAHSATPEDAPLLRTTVSSVSSPWVEGTSSGYKRQEGASSFYQAETGKRDWSYGPQSASGPRPDSPRFTNPRSTFMDVAFGRGNTLWRFAEASAPNEDNWQAVAVSPDVIAARVAGLSHGFGVCDDVGSVWSYEGDTFEYHYFPNRFIHSRESNFKPYFEIWISGEDSVAPGNVSGMEVETDGFPAGEALVSWVTPADSGGGKTLGYHVRYRRGEVIEDMPRYLIPMAGKAGDRVKMHIQDVPFDAGEEITLLIQAVDSAGNVGETVSKDITLSAHPAVFAIEQTDIQPFAAGGTLPSVGGLKVCVVDLVDKIRPDDGKMIPAQPDGYKTGNHLWSAKEKAIRLFSARNEAVCFQVNLEGKSSEASLSLRFPDAPDMAVKLFRFDYAKTEVGVLPDALLEVDKSFAVPFADDPEAKGAKNVSLLAEVYVPHDTPAGKQAGVLTVTSGGESLEIPVELNVWAFTLPNKLSFVPEMNAYGTVSPNTMGYYRLAHEHRLCSNRLYYGWTGAVQMAPEWTGSELRFEEWDKQFGPLFDGSAFEDLPRSGEPVDVFYLHFNENWPMDVFKHYSPNYWADEAFTDKYRKGMQKAYADMARHFNDKQWHDTLFQFYLNNKVYYKRDVGWKGSSAPWIFDEPVNIQDFWALRWYGLLWQEAVNPVMGDAKMWYRGDISYSQYGRDCFWGVMDLECFGGACDQKVRQKHDEQILWADVYFTEYGSGNAPRDPNSQPLIWCLKAWGHGAVGILPWQTIGAERNFTDMSRSAKGEQALFLPHDGKIIPSVRLKSFRRGQQDVEYLTLLGDVYDQPHFAIANGTAAVIDLSGKLRKRFETDAGTMYFDKANPTALWHLRVRVGEMVSAKKPPYKRVVRPMPTPNTSVNNVPDIGYVRVAPDLPSSKPVFKP